ncbi:MAG: hypothetical protein ACRC2T_07750, partial [Thermoguttaceae bacterium]
VYAQIAQAQIKARLLGDAFQTINELLPSDTKTELLQNLATEQLKINQFNEAQNTIRQLPNGVAKSKLALRLMETHESLTKLLEGKNYSNPQLEIIEAAEVSESSKDKRKFDVVLEMIQDGQLIDAKETALKISDQEIRSNALGLIVREITNTLRPYTSEEPLHLQVRRELTALAFQAARRMTNPVGKAEAMESILSQVGWLDHEGFLDSFWAEAFEAVDAMIGAASSDNLEVVNIITRLVGGKLRSLSDDWRSLISGYWYTLPSEEKLNELVLNVPHLANTITDIKKCKQLLEKAGEIAARIPDVASRIDCEAGIASLFLQLHDVENGTRYSNLVVNEIEHVNDYEKRANVMLKIAQAMQLADGKDTAEVFFEYAKDSAQKLYAKENIMPGQSSRILEKRAKDRVLSDIARGEAEIGLIENAMKTASLISEPMFRDDKIFKPTGYFLLYQGEYTKAEEAFNKLANEKYRSAALKDTAFRKRWGNVAGDK